MTLSSIVLYSNPITATVMLSATTIQIPVAIISSATKYLGKAKDFVLNNIPAAQLLLLAVISYYVFDKSSQVGHYVFDMQKATMSLPEAITVNPEDTEKQKEDKIAQVVINTRYNDEARDALSKVNEEGQNLLGQAAKAGNFEAVEIMVDGPHATFGATAIDIAQHPALNFADAVVNGANAVLNKVSPKLGGILPNRTINQGATAEEINNADNNGQTLLHIEAENFNTAKGVEVIEKTVKNGGDLGKPDNKGNTPLVSALENKALTEAVNPTKIVKVLTDNGKQLTVAAAPIAKNAEKAELIKPVVEFAEQKNGYIFGRDNAEKLLAGTLKNAVEVKNIEVVKALIPTINNIAMAEQVKKEMPALTKEIEVREEALTNPCNQNPLKIAATGARKSGIKPSDVKSYMENETVPTSHKAFSAVALVPHVPAMINDAIIDTAVSTSSKVAGWVGNFLEAVGEELGKAITLDSDFNANTSTDYAAVSKDTQGQSYGDYTTSLDQLLIGEANGQLFLECAKE
jgi:ankyrin repeat protein